MNTLVKPYLLILAMAGGGFAACSAEDDGGDPGTGGLPPYDYTVTSTNTESATTTNTSTHTGIGGVGGTGGTDPLGTGGIIGTGGVVGSGGGVVGTGGGTGGVLGTGGIDPGTGGTTASFPWPSSYNPGGLPNPPGGEHHAGDACMSSGCHGGARRAFVYGGTVYTSNGVAAANVEIGISDGSNTYTTYSATNGNFWLASGSINWATAIVAIRTSNGEVVKPSNAGVTADCNNCHSGGNLLVAP